MKKFILFMLTALILTGCTSEAKQNIELGKENDKMQINIEIGEKIFTATLEDNPSTRELINRLPLEIKMSELNGNEKYFRFNKNLPSNDMRIGNISTGDLMLYSSSYLVLFYKDFPTSYSYTRLGKIDNPAGLFETVGRGDVITKIYIAK